MTENNSKNFKHINGTSALLALTNEMIENKFLIDIIMEFLMEAGITTKEELSKKLGERLTNFALEAKKYDEEMQQEIKQHKDELLGDFLKKVKPTGEA